MTVSPVGDLAQYLQLSRQNAAVQNDLNRLTEEVASGLTSDIGATLNGNFTALGEIERGLRVADSYEMAAGRAGSHYASIQAGLEAMDDGIGSYGTEILSMSVNGQVHEMELLAKGAEDHLEMVIGTLNMDVAGRAAFSGTATGTQAVIPAEDMLAELEIAIAGAPDTASLIATVESWFGDPGGGYETFAYQGNTAPSPGFTIDEGEIVAPQTSALDPAFRELLTGLALTSLVGRGATPQDDAAMSEIMTAGAEHILTGQDQTVELRSEIGIAEGRIEDALTRHRATTAALTLERNDLIAVDAYEAASELTAVEAQLETIYVLTSRLSQMSLVNYL